MFLSECGSVAPFACTFLQGSCWETFKKSFKELSPRADAAEWLLTSLRHFLLCHLCHSMTFILFAFLYMPGMEMGIPPNPSFALFLFFMYKYNSDSAVVLLELTTASVASPASFNFCQIWVSNSIIMKKRDIVTFPSKPFFQILCGLNEASIPCRSAQFLIATSSLTESLISCCWITLHLLSLWEKVIQSAAVISYQTSQTLERTLNQYLLS